MKYRMCKDSEMSQNGLVGIVFYDKNDGNEKGTPHFSSLTTGPGNIHIVFVVFTSVAPVFRLNL